MQAFITFLTLAATVSAGTIQISVGNTGINFTPNSTTAAVGDILAFHFYTGTGPHSVVRSTFNSPCAPEVGAAEFYSGYLVGDDAGSQTYEVTVTNTDPIWYYCSAKKHCQNGMVGVINPPSNATVEQYAIAAKNIAAASSLSEPVGGTSTSLAVTATGGSTGISAQPSTTGHTTSTGVAASATSSSGVSSKAASASSVGSSVASSASAAATSAKPASAPRIEGDGKAIGVLAVIACGLVALMA